MFEQAVFFSGLLNLLKNVFRWPVKSFGVKLRLEILEQFFMYISVVALTCEGA